MSGDSLPAQRGSVRIVRAALFGIYSLLVLRLPRVTLAAAALVVGFFAYYSNDFRLDASADSLVLENDEALQYYRAISARYGSDEFLVVTYSPNDDLFAPHVLADLGELRDKLAEVPTVGSVVSLLDIPLVQSPPVTLDEIEAGVRTLEDADTDPIMARAEILASPIYRELIISTSGRTTAMQVNFERDETHTGLLNVREALREKRLIGNLTPEDTLRLDDVSHAYDLYTIKVQKQQSTAIADVRAIMDEHRDTATLYLGGVPMIAADSVEFIRQDLVSFGAGVFIFLVFLLGVAFRRPRWVVLPLMTCTATGLTMMGVLGYYDWPVTVVSSNFISLLLIITLSLTIHLIVRYDELHHETPDADQRTLVKGMIQSKFLPCLYAVLTTIVAFGSLLVSGIHPVIEFGRMMAIGVSIGMIYSFTLFPAAVLILKPGKPVQRRDIAGLITRGLAWTVHRAGIPVMVLFVGIAAVGLTGIAKLSVENRFIDYYKDTTEIYRGMELIDKELGGTTPLEVIIDAPASFGMVEAEEVEDDFDDFDDDWLDEEDNGAGITSTSYWFNNDKLPDVAEIHDYLDGLPETGKVLSLVNSFRVLKQVDPGVAEDDFLLSIVYKRLPQDLKDLLLSPYMSEDGNQLRFAIRVFESDPNLRRNELIDRIQTHLTQELGLEVGQVHVTGMLVLYNNMLQSLYRSQILTLGVVFLSIMAMFMVLFRNWRMAIIGIVPNVISAGLVLGLMGWRGIPLDIMTITIAAIAIGIAVDNTIHYVDRFTKEFKIDGDTWAAISRSHGSIGKAMYYTSVSIALGFSILALSNFVPTVYFGLLTGFAMLVALLANLTLLPLLIAWFKPIRRPAHVLAT